MCWLLSLACDLVINFFSLLLIFFFLSMQVSRGGCPQQSLNFAVDLAASGGGGGSGRKGGLDDQRWRRDWSADRILWLQTSEDSGLPRKLDG